MLLKYLESCSLSISVASQLSGTQSLNTKQVMAFGSDNAA